MINFVWRLHIMVTFPIAKINIGLNVTKKRNDGFHDIETVFYPIGLSDILEIVPAEDGVFGFKQSGIPSGRAEYNLCVRAYRIFNEQRMFPAVKLHLHKMIPVGAGLGGGSSDAAFTLKMLNHIFQAGLTGKELFEMAEALGSDCPFFLDPRPVYATGRGTTFTPVSLEVKDRFLALVKPKTSVSTPLAYSLVTPAIPSVRLQDSIQQPVALWQDLIHNDFEAPVLQHFPPLRNIPEKLKDLGALFVAMSGSGSSFYGIFDHLPDKLESRFPYCFTWKGPF